MVAAGPTPAIVPVPLEELDEEAPPEELDDELLEELEEEELLDELELEELLLDEELELPAPLDEELDDDPFTDAVPVLSPLLLPLPPPPPQATSATQTKLATKAGSSP